MKNLYVFDCDSRIGGGEYIVFNSLKDAEYYADERACYCQRDINIYSKKHTYTRRWWGTCGGVEECEDPIKFGEFGFYGDWEEDNMDHSDWIRGLISSGDYEMF